MRDYIPNLTFFKKRIFLLVCMYAKGHRKICGGVVLLDCSIYNYEGKKSRPLRDS